MSISKIPNAKPHDAKTLAAPTRREHATAAVVGGSTIVQGEPANAIEAHANMGKAARKTLQAFTPVHPSTQPDQLSGRGHATTKHAPAVAPIKANPPIGKGTRSLPAHPDALGRGASGRETPGGTTLFARHDMQIGDRIMDEAFDNGHVNNKIPGERHHSVAAPRQLPSKPSDSQTTPNSLADQFMRWNKGEC